jgi:hypothetical protein
MRLGIGVLKTDQTAGIHGRFESVYITWAPGDTEAMPLRQSLVGRPVRLVAVIDVARAPVARPPYVGSLPVKLGDRLVLGHGRLRSLGDGTRVGIEQFAPSGSLQLNLQELYAALGQTVILHAEPAAEEAAS